MAGSGGRELVERWRGILEAEDTDEARGEDGSDRSLSSSRRTVQRSKEKWFSDTYNFLINLPKATHIWCGCWELMGPLLETFHNFSQDKANDSPLSRLWKRISQELGRCTQCVCQHHQAQEAYATDFELDSIGPLLRKLRSLDEHRVVEHLQEINKKMSDKEYNPEDYSAEVVSIMFEVLMFPTLLDDRSLVFEFQTFIEAVDSSHDVALSGHQQYPGVYALLFLKSSKARAIGLRLAKSMGKMRCAADLEPLQPLLKKYIGFLETEVLLSDLEGSRPRVEHERLAVWLGIKTLLGFVEPPAFEEGILERYPVFVSIVLNHVSDDTPEFSHAVNCLKILFEMLGCKLWLRTTLSPSVMRNTLLGQSFHTRNEKSHKEIFDLFLPFLQSLEALLDGEHEKQRRNLLYFLLHQVTQSSNFSLLMRKNACKIALLIIYRGYKMNPPCPPFECAHMWGPSLVGSLKDSSLHSSLRQPAFDLMQTILISDAAALSFLTLKHLRSLTVDMTNSTNFRDAEDAILFLHDDEEESNCWNQCRAQEMLVSLDCKEWSCVPMLWLEVLVQVDPFILPISFCKAVFWALSRFSVLDAETNTDNQLDVRDWMSAHCKEVSNSLVWETPRGSDDGGDGKESKNSVKASSTCIPLVRAFKRCGAYFLVQVEKCGLHKQFIWEPRMAECLVLSLIDPNDVVRQADRIILETVSKTQGLASGLQFLCSTATSLSAMLSGLKYVLKQIQSNADILGFRDLHHLFFIIFKLLKEVAPLQRAVVPSDDSNHSQLVSGGGFLHQPFFDYSPIKGDNGSKNVVDLQSWKTFSCYLSSITWPCILKYLVNGKHFIDNRNCQMTCVRFLEIIPAVFERMSISPSITLTNISDPRSSIFEFKWLSDLADWGRSSLVVVIRHWKKSFLTLLNLMKSSLHMSTSSSLDAIGTMVNSDNILVDEIKTRLSEISVLNSKSSSRLKREHLALARELHATEPVYPDIKDLFIDKVHVTYEKERIPAESDGQSENMISQIKLDRDVPVCEDKTSVLSTRPLSKLNATHRPSKVFGRSGLVPQKHGNAVFNRNERDPAVLNSVDQNSISARSSEKHVKDKSKSSLLSKMVESSNYPFPAEILHIISDGSDESEDSVQGEQRHTISENISGNTERNNFRTTLSGIQVRSVHEKSDQIPGRVEKLYQEKKVHVLKDTIFDSDDDESSEPKFEPPRLPAELKKPCLSVPKRKVIQLEMPENRRDGLQRRLESGVRRLKPPKLDDWYRPILEMDYFSVVGLSSDDIDVSASLSELKEIPQCFTSPDHYIQIFRPLVLEEFKAQLKDSFLEASSSEETVCGNLCVLSVERVDNFHMVRARPEDIESARSFSENDLVLLAKEPLQNNPQHVHVLGKLERREKNDRRRSPILVIRFYLQGHSSRLIKVSRLLTERSKWYISRIMSITPQLREFQALSSLSFIPMLPAILRPTDCRGNANKTGKVELSSLKLSMQKMLKSSFNDSQLQAISVAIQGCQGSFGLSLIQGPPGTGKTRTIVAITSALLSLGSSKRVHTPKELDKMPRADNRPRISQSVAAARAWQDAAFAKQMIREDEERHINFNSMNKSAGGRILVCAQSNAAVDELVSRIKGGLYGEDGKLHKPYLVRVGNAKTVHPDSIPVFIDTLVDQRLGADYSFSDKKNEISGESSASLQARLEKLVDNIRLYESKRAKLQDQDSSKSSNIEDASLNEGNLDGEMNFASTETKLKTLYGQKKTLCMEINAAQARERKLSEENKVLKQKVRRSILQEAEVVVTTLSGCGGDLYSACFDFSAQNRLGDSRECSLFDAVIIDEAAQALEPATLIPLQLLKSYGAKCVMVGDPKQLPATVLSGVASKFLFECSMFERMQRAGHPVIMLTEQYRMHPEICKFPSSHFYGGKLLNGISMVGKSLAFHETPSLGPYMFFDVSDGRENRGKRNNSLSLYNEAEADMAVAIITFFRERYPSEFSAVKIGVITPYKSQLSLLRSRFSSTLGPSVVANVEFKTVDGFQGREVDILLLSTVRASACNSRDRGNTKLNSIGFVADMRRMNVALTRAKHSLWIIGNAMTLQTNLHWGKLLMDTKERNLFMSVARPYAAALQNTLCLVKESHQNVKTLGGGSGSEPLSIKNPRKPNNQESSVERRIIKKSDNNLKDTSGKKTSVSCEMENVSGKASVRKNKRVNSGILEPSKIASDAQSSVGEEKKAAEVEGKRDNCKNSHEDIISKRKRQREAVDALLSSALISSKKPESSSKPASKRRPSSPRSSKGRTK
ncbi:P-loop containing nucleoside triphosphate hydrolases superfamily protein [Wolffia australiana]